MMNLPNILACCRIVLAPVLFFLLSFEFTGLHQSWVDYFAALAFGIAALTDFFDGYIARAWGQKTKLGAILDPLADKMLMLGAFLGLLLRESAVNASVQNETIYLIEIWTIYLILVREFFITGFRVIMASERLDLSASFAGKLKTAFQIIAVIFLIMHWDFGLYLDTIFLLIAFVLTIYSGFEYIVKYQKHIKKDSK